MTLSDKYAEWEEQRKLLAAEVEAHDPLKPEWVAAMKKLIAHDLFEPSWLLEQIKKGKK